MTIQELIDFLQTVENKDGFVFFSELGYYHDVMEAELETLPNGSQNLILR